MKKIIYLFLFLIISMYYTNKSIDILKSVDPIMKHIKSTNNKYKINPVDAIVEGNEIQSGSYGKEIDIKKSYNKMKQYGTYNEALTVLKDSKPTISIEDNYDKYLIKGNPNNRNISLVFKLRETKNIVYLLKLLDEKNVQVTFFIDGTLLENNYKNIKKLHNHEVEVLSYDNRYEKTLMETTIAYLETVTNKKAKYCYTEEDNNDLLKICASNKLHTIKPTLVLGKDIYKNIKHNVSSGIVITIDNYMIDDLSSSIDYLKAKGYSLVTVHELFSEN